MAIKRILDKVEKQKQLLDGFWVHPFFNPLPSKVLWSPISLTIQHCLGGSGEGASLLKLYHFLDPNTFDPHCTNFFSPLEILLKNMFCSYSWAVFWSLSCHRKLKLTTKPFTGHTLCARCKILACVVRACT